MAIRLLSEEIALRIAAGEIVERPASVLKELVENALDAGATSVRVFAEGGGLKLLSVIDDGCGMDRQDLELCVAKHATSKLNTLSDLDVLATFGFRGEALAAISSVAMLTIRTRQRGSRIGHRLEARSGKALTITEEACAEGTEIRVEGLFSTVPARLKFLKSEQHEQAQLQETLLRLALPAIETDFRMDRNGTMALHLPKTPSMLARILKLFQGAGRSDFLPVEAQRDGISLTGFVGDPDFSRSQAKAMIFYVNGRLIKDRRLQTAVSEAYRTTLMKGRYPCCVLFLSLPGTLVDINVHPQKAEVRFAKPDVIFGLVHTAVRAAIEARGHADTLVAQPVQQSATNRQALSLPYPVSIPSSRATGVASPDKGGAIWRNPGLLKAGLSFPGQQPESQALERPFLYASLRYLGQFAKTYLICEGQQALYILDQHAAYERLAFERLRSSLGQVPSQGLMFPWRLEDDQLTGLDPELLKKTFVRLGFAIGALDETGLQVTAVPEVMTGLAWETLLGSAVGEIAEQGAAFSLESSLEALFASMACHGAVRAEDALLPGDVAALFRDLDAIPFARHCPHGRPIFYAMTVQDIEARIGRR